MIGTVLLILVLLALCGFVAYMGDLLGRRLGKRRLMIFGLRPRYTAILLTIVTGVLIAGITFGAAMIIVPGFQKVVTQGERLVRTNAQLEAQIQQRRRQNEELIAANSQLAGDNERLGADNVRLAAENQRLERGNRALQTRSEELDRQNRHLNEQNAALQASTRLLRSRTEELRRQNTRLAADARRLESRRVSLDREVRGLRASVGDLRQQVTEYAREEYSFQRHQVLSLRPIPAEPPPDVLRRSVGGVLYEAETAAREQSGVEPDRDALVLERPAGFPTDRPLTPAELGDWAVRRARGLRRTPLLMRVVSTENALKKRPVRVRLDFLPNRLVFQRGDLVAERTISGGATEGAVLAELLIFLRRDVRLRALRESILSTNDYLLEYNLDDLLASCREIRAHAGPVVVTARARQDTLITGPLNIRLESAPLAAAPLTRYAPER